MILNTGNRTDIPAFYTPWFMNRVKSGEVLVRSPYAEIRSRAIVSTPVSLTSLFFVRRTPIPSCPI